MRVACKLSFCLARTALLIVFNDFIEENGLTDDDDETVTVALIKSLSQELAPRVLLEDFP